MRPRTASHWGCGFRRIPPKILHTGRGMRIRFCSCGARAASRCSSWTASSCARPRPARSISLFCGPSAWAAKTAFCSSRTSPPRNALDTSARGNTARSLWKTAIRILAATTRTARCAICGFYPGTFLPSACCSSCSIPGATRHGIKTIRSRPCAFRPIICLPAFWLPSRSSGWSSAALRTWTQSVCAALCVYTGSIGMRCGCATCSR